jgi:hypothetical protein
MLKSMKMMMGENRTSWANRKSMWQWFEVLRVERQKVSLIRQPIAYYCEARGLCSHPTLVTWYRKGRSTQHLRWVIRPTWRTARNIIFYRWMQYAIFYNNNSGCGKMNNSQDQFPAIHVCLPAQCLLDCLMLSAWMISSYLCVQWFYVRLLFCIWLCIQLVT